MMDMCLSLLILGHWLNLLVLYERFSTQLSSGSVPFH